MFTAKRIINVKLNSISYYTCISLRYIYEVIGIQIENFH